MDHSTYTNPLARRLPATALSIALLTLVALTGCDSGTQEPDAPESAATEFGAVPEAPAGASEPREQPGDGSIAANRFLAEMPEGFEAAIPSNFPRSLPIYPGAAPAIGSGGNVGDSSRAGVQLLSNDAPNDVFNFYEKELGLNGWKIDNASSEGGFRSITASNGESLMTLFITPSADGGSDVFVVAEEPSS
jgi:hypothetical protein